jgi:hypothetical protein
MRRRVLARDEPLLGLLRGGRGEGGSGNRKAESGRGEKSDVTH